MISCVQFNPHHPLDRKWTFLCTIIPEVSNFTVKQSLYEQLPGHQNWKTTWGQHSDYVLSSHRFRYDRKWGQKPLFWLFFNNFTSVWSTFKSRKSIESVWAKTVCSLRRRNWHWQIPEVTPRDRKLSVSTGNGPKCSVKLVFYCFLKSTYYFFNLRELVIRFVFVTRALCNKYTSVKVSL